ncbi:MAG: hypothetical protein JKY37_10715 [Nannocystaceae bacterium]|nr:hypothetical protein [Nannocystaceae bacterium]
MYLERRTIFTVAMAVGVGFACNVGDGETPDFSSGGGSAGTNDADGRTSDSGGSEETVEASADGTTGRSGTTDTGLVTGASSGNGGTDASSVSSTGENESGVMDGATTDGTSTDGGTTDNATTGSVTDGATTDGSAESTSTDGGSSEGSSETGVTPSDAYEPCNANGTCDQPGEVCLEAGVGGFCTTTCANAMMCPDAPAGTTLTADCEFLLGFPAFDANYCGIIGCNFIFNDCPTGMTCTPVVMGLTVCEWT